MFDCFGTVLGKGGFIDIDPGMLSLGDLTDYPTDYILVVFIARKVLLGETNWDDWEGGILWIPI